MQCAIGDWSAANETAVSRPIREPVPSKTLIHVKRSTNFAITELLYKMKIHTSCEIEDFVETHLCKLCVILRSRVLRVVCPN